jgi:hypothetical protein
MPKKVTRTQQASNAAKLDLKPTIFEPKVQNRWICYIKKDGKELIPPYLIKGFQRPAVSRVKSPDTSKELAVSPSVVRRIGGYRGSYLTAGDMVLQAYDPIQVSASKLFNALLDADQVFTTHLVFLGPVGDKVEEWVYSGCRVKSLAFSPLDWGNNNDPSTVTATISVLSTKLL